jgi:DNA-binding transcriptional regulator YdaS (Cro superfamily)
MDNIVIKHDSQAIRKAISYYGSIPKLAKEIGVHKSAIDKWLAGINSPSAQSCIKIEKATKKNVKRNEIRKDIDW